MTRLTLFLALLATQAQAAEQGLASRYAQPGRTASGERFHNCLCMAHRSAPLGSYRLVTNERTGQAALLRVNDRGPFRRGRIADLTPAAARAVGLTARAGLARVRVEEVAEMPR